MWLAGNKKADVFVGINHAMVSSAGEIILEHGDGLEACSKICCRILSEIAGSCQISVWLSGGLCRSFLVPENLNSIKSEGNKAYQILANELTDLSLEKIEDYHVQVSGRIGLAASKNQIALLISHFAKHKIATIQPWWIAVFNHELGREKELSGFGCADMESMTVLYGKDAPTSTHTQYPVAPEHATKAWNRSAMEHEIKNGCSAFIMMAPDKIPMNLHRTKEPFPFSEIIQRIA